MNIAAFQRKIEKNKPMTFTHMEFISCTTLTKQQLLHHFHMSAYQYNKKIYIVPVKKIGEELHFPKSLVSLTS